MKLYQTFVVLIFLFLLLPIFGCKKKNEITTLDTPTILNIEYVSTKGKYVVKIEEVINATGYEIYIYDTNSLIYKQKITNDGILDYYVSGTYTARIKAIGDRSHIDSSFSPFYKFELIDYNPPVEFTYATLEEYKEFLTEELTKYYTSMLSYVDGTYLNEINTKFLKLVADLKNKQTIKEAKNFYNESKLSLFDELKVADGIYASTTLSKQDKIKIIASLENYAIMNNLTGIIMLDKKTSTVKLNINTCDQNNWEYLFGSNGIVYNNPTDEYWTVNPVLNNKNFVKALSYSIDRKTLGAKKELSPSINYFPSDFSIDDVNYNDTTYHKNNIKNLINDTDGYGFSLELARKYFRIALLELEEDNKIKPGTLSNPTIIKIEIAWQTTNQVYNYHNFIKKCLETAFNDESVSGGGYKLEIDSWVGSSSSSLYEEKILKGHYDLGFGNISTTSKYEKLLATISTNTNISNNYGLNYGINTNDVNYCCIYNNQRFSYDALYMYLDFLAKVENGKNVDIYTLLNANLTTTNNEIEIKGTIENINANLDISIIDFFLLSDRSDLKISLKDKTEIIKTKTKIEYTIKLDKTELAEILKNITIKEYLQASYLKISLNVTSSFGEISREDEVFIIKDI